MGRLFRLELLVSSLVLWVGLVAGMPGLADEDFEPAEREVLDMSPGGPATWSGRYLIAPVISLIRGPSYMYAPRSIEIDTTPSGGYVDLFYVRSGFQKRFEQAEAPLTVILPSRLKAGSRDSFTIRAFAEGYRQQSVSFRVTSSIDEVSIDLEPLPNLLDAVSHRYFAGRSSLAFLTKEALTFRVQQADDGFAVVLTETAMSDDARRSVQAIRSPLIEEGYAQQLGEDLMVKLVLTARGQEEGTEVRSRRSYDAPRDLYDFSIDLVPRDGGRSIVSRSLAALASLTPADVSGCALAFDDSLRIQLEPGSLARALTPRGSFTDRYLRAAMRRLGEVSVDGVVDFVDGTQFRPTTPIELEMSLSKADGARGYLALLRRFVAELEDEKAHRREALRSLLAPELSGDHFDALVERAERAETSCSGTDS